MRTKTITLILTFSLMFWTAMGQVAEQTKLKMFRSALENFSTAPNYIVVTVKDKKTGETKEICTEAPFFQGAIEQETGNWKFKSKNYKRRYFEFSKDSALSNISFDLYTKDELDEYAKAIKLEETITHVKNGQLTSKTFMGDGKEQIMFAHLMFNCGVMVTRGCIAGNVCELTPFRSQ